MPFGELRITDAIAEKQDLQGERPMIYPKTVSPVNSRKADVRVPKSKGDCGLITMTSKRIMLHALTR